ncbi:MAG: hypothetical protein H6590_02930 [Flavobacteriales bacterium]|nr:hypothetical protein [Flavobacteriales bacterium]
MGTRCSSSSSPRSSLLPRLRTSGTRGFTGTAPIPGIVLDPATGQLSFTPTVTGNYVVVLEVTTYNSMGVPIGTIRRDFLFVVQNCMTTPPTTTGLTNSTTGFIVGTGAIEVCDGALLCGYPVH